MDTGNLLQLDFQLNIKNNLSRLKNHLIYILIASLTKKDLFKCLEQIRNREILTKIMEMKELTKNIENLYLKLENQNKGLNILI